MEKNVIREIDSEELSEDLSEDDTFSDDIEEDLASPPTSGQSTPKKKAPKINTSKASSLTIK